MPKHKTERNFKKKNVFNFSNKFEVNFTISKEKKMADLIQTLPSSRCRSGWQACTTHSIGLFSNTTTTTRCGG